MTSLPRNRSGSPKLVTRAELTAQMDAKLRRLLNGFNFFWGPMGLGKTLSGTACAYNIKKLYGMPVVSIGTDLGFTDEFGDYTFLTDREFVEQVQLLNELARAVSAANISPSETQEFIDEYRAEHELLLYGATLLIDELQNYANARRGNARLAQVFNSFVGVMRHYQSTLFGMAPRYYDVDIKFRNQAKWHGRPEINKVSGWCTLRLKGPEGTMGMRIYAPTYATMYNSWQPIAFDTKGLERVLEKDV